MILNHFHVAVTRSGTTVRLFVNGVVEATATGNSTNFNESLTLYIGAETGNSLYLNGYIDDLRITKGYARYTSNFTAPTSALLTK